MLAASSTFWTVGRRGPVGDQLGPLPGQVAELAHRRRRHEARREQAVLEQLGDPLGVLDVGLPPRHLLDVPGVDQHQVESTLEQVPDRLPGDAGGLHGEVADPPLGQPVGQLEEVGGHGGEGADLAGDLAAGPDRADAGDDGLLVDIQAGAAGMKHVQGGALPV
jgi:hypothetical protein